MTENGKVSSCSGIQPNHSLGIEVFFVCFNVYVCMYAFSVPSGNIFRQCG